MAKAAHPFDAIKYLYHFTDVRSIPSVQENGGLWSQGELLARRINVANPGGEVARKMMRASHDRLGPLVGADTDLFEERKKALHFLLWWGDEEA